MTWRRPNVYFSSISSMSFPSFSSISFPFFPSLEKWLLVSLLFLSTASSSPLSGSKGACWDFSEGACDLSENNILDHDRFVDSPGECQVPLHSSMNFLKAKTEIWRFVVQNSENFEKAKLSTCRQCAEMWGFHNSKEEKTVHLQAMCRDLPSCNWFTHFSTQCYLLAECGDSAQLVIQL